MWGVEVVRGDEGVVARGVLLEHEAASLRARLRERLRLGSIQRLRQIEVSGRATWAHLVVCGDEVYIRDLKGLTAYSWK